MLVNKMISIFSFPYRVRYHETDHGGRVYHSHYLVWMEIARTEFLRSKHIIYKQFEDNGMFLVMYEAHVKYLSSAAYEDEILINILFVKCCGVRIDFSYSIYNNTTNRVAVEAILTLVFLNKEGKPTQIPEIIKTLI